MGRAALQLFLWLVFSSIHPHTHSVARYVYAALQHQQPNNNSVITQRHTGRRTPSHTHHPSAAALVPAPAGLEPSVSQTLRHVLPCPASSCLVLRCFLGAVFRLHFHVALGTSIIRLAWRDVSVLMDSTCPLWSLASPLQTDGQHWELETVSAVCLPTCWQPERSFLPVNSCIESFACLFDSPQDLFLQSSECFASWAQVCNRLSVYRWNKGRSEERERRFLLLMRERERERYIIRCILSSDNIH